MKQLLNNISDYFIPDIAKSSREDYWLAVCLVNAILFVVFTVLLSSFLVLVVNIESEFPHTVVASSCLILLFLYKWSKSINLIANLLALMIFASVFMDILYHGGLLVFGTAFLVVVPYIAFVFSKRLSGFIWTAILVITYFLLYAHEIDQFNFLPIEELMLDADLGFVANLIFLTFMLGLIFVIVSSQRIIIDELEKTRIRLESKQTQLEQKQTQLEETQKKLKRSNDELVNFAESTAHDLKQPIRTVSSFGARLEKELNGSLTPRAKEYLDFIVQGSQDMNEMVTALLSYSKLDNNQALVFEEIETKPFLERVILKLTNQIKTVNAEIIVEDIPEYIIGNKITLTKLFQNLISNALKYHKKDQPPIVTIRGHFENDQWQFSVQDNGIGIDKKYHDKVFSIFTTVHNSSTYEGNGIGLANCHKIVEAHNGKIWLNSELGKGATFLFTLEKSCVEAFVE